MSRAYRSGTTFAKPENALKRAEELEAVGQRQAALQVLHDVVTSKRHRTWQKTLEDIMFKYVDLSVEMKRGRSAKEALMQYRNVCQQVNVNSLEEVIKYLLKTATAKAEEAQAQAETKDLVAADLEEDLAPEDLMLSYVSGDKSKDRTERELVTPWFKFLWETYRNTLEILRNNSRLEALYAMTAQRAFQFCQQYKRTMEFRRLCDILRTHLANLNRYPQREQRDRPDLTQPDSLQLYLETRFEQLKTACELEMWQEAFRSIEDIHGLMQYGKKPPKPQMMATYYAKLVQIFDVSGSNLYHAYAWYKLFNLSRQYNKNMSAHDQQMMACSVLLAALSIVPYERKDPSADSALDRERSVRMAAILGFTVDHKRDARELLSRNALLSDLLSKGIHGMVPAAVSQIYRLLESDFDPLHLCDKLEPLIASLDEMPSAMSAASPVSVIVLGRFKEHLQKLAVLRMCEQLSQVYSVMKIEKLSALVPFMEFSKVELAIVDAVKYNYLQLSIDHRNGTVHFASSHLAPEKMKNHLSLLAKRLSRAVGMITPSGETEKAARVTELISKAKTSVPTEHFVALERKKKIEKRKEEQEQMSQEQERQEEEKRLKQLRINEEAEEKRLAAERLKREEERLRKEMEAKELEEAKALIQAAGKKGRVIKEGEKIDREALLQEARIERLKELQEMERKLARTAKQLDHFERARREEEVPLLEQAYEQQKVDDKIYHEEQQRAFLEQHRKAWEVDVQEKHRLARMHPDREAFQQQIISRRAEEFEALMLARQERIEAARAQRKRERDLERRRRYVARVREEKESEMLAEEQARLDEERARIEAEEARKAEIRRQEEEERRAKLEEAARKQQEKLEEVERRQMEEREAHRRGGPGEREDRQRPPPFAPRADDQSWRAREAPPAGGAPPRGYQPPARRAAAAGGGGGGGRADMEDNWMRRDGPSGQRPGEMGDARRGPPGPRQDEWRSERKRDTWQRTSRPAGRNDRGDRW